MQTYYINLDRDTERRTHIERELDRVGMAATRVTAVELPFVLADSFFDTTKLSAGEASCYASHLKVWDGLLLADAPFALVLEDDALLPADLKRTLAETVQMLPQGWDIVHLYAKCHRSVRPLLTIPGRYIVRYSRVPSGTVAYLISREGAQKLSRHERRVWPVDTDLRRPWHWGLDSYGVDPAPVAHASFGSSLLCFGERSRRRRGLFASPLRSATSLAWNLRKLGPVWWARCLAKNVHARWGGGRVTRPSAEPSLA